MTADARQPSALVTLALGATTTISYGTNYYAFGVIAPAVAVEFGVSLTTLFALLSTAIAASGLTAPFSGRLVDRTGGARAMAAGSLASMAALIAMATAPGIAPFAAALVGLQMASTLVFYDAAFATGLQLAPERIRKVVTGITLIAGFSSTLFWPLTIGLESHGLTWRDILLGYAALNVLVNLPVHLLLSRLPRIAPAREAAAAGRNGGARAARHRFALAAFLFFCVGVMISGLHANMVAVLAPVLGAAQVALFAAVIGPAQVAGRLAEFALGARISPLGVATASLAAMAAGLATMALAPQLPWMMVGAAMVYGAGQGLSSIARGTLPLHLFGAAGYGALAGRFNGIYLIAMATGPVTLSAVAERLGARAFFLALAAAGLCGLAAAALLRRIWRGD